MAGTDAFDIAERPINLRCGRQAVATFPDGLPPGASITITPEQEPRGKRIRVKLPKSATIAHRRRRKPA